MAFIKYNTGVTNYILEYMECRCMSTEHLIKFYLDTDEADICLDVHLATRLPWYRRFWRGITYTLGYKSKYGDFDNMIMKEEDINRLIDLLAYYKKIKQKKEEVGEKCSP